jgi:hypothetical protein
MKKTYPLHNSEIRILGVCRSSGSWHTGNCRRCSNWPSLTCRPCWQRQTVEWWTFTETSAGIFVQHFRVHVLVFGVFLVLHCAFSPSGNPTHRSQMELNLANVELLTISVSVYPSVWVIVIKRGRDVMMVMWGCWGVRSKFSDLRTVDKLSAQWIPQACWGTLHQ